MHRQQPREQWLDGYEARDLETGRLVLGVPTWSVPSIEPVSHIAAGICSMVACWNYAYTRDRAGLCRAHWLDLWAASRGIIPSAHVDPTTGQGRNPVADEPPLTAPAPLYAVTFHGVYNDEAALTKFYQGAWVSIVSHPNYEHNVHWAGVRVHPTGTYLIVDGSALWTIE